MKANELRIGNRVLYKNIPVILSAEDFPQLQYDIDDGIIKPIPLTEDWLVKFGFELAFMRYEIDISVFPNLEYKKLVVDLGQGVLIRQGDLDGKRHKDDLVTLFNIDKQGKLFVHLLQNLYFCLTQKELNYVDR